MYVHKVSPWFTESCFLLMPVEFYKSLPNDYHQANYTGDFRDFLVKYFQIVNCNYMF